MGLQTATLRPWSADSAILLQAVAGAVRRELENALTRNSAAGFA
jgi:hypothetical protein